MMSWCSLLLVAQHSWPDDIDTAVIASYLLLAFGLPTLGYVFMVLDFRAYLRSLRRALIVARNYLPDLPEWARKDTPRCLIALGLTLPCSSEEVLAAYRVKVKELHPDRGGDRRAFLQLQKHFEESLSYVEQATTVTTVAVR